tara:strand:- start:278 stop:400 length:123 start_codon:yes stop_codon:yes gene_type:complete
METRRTSQNKELDKKRSNAEFAEKRDFLDYENFGSAIFSN